MYIRVYVRYYSYTWHADVIPDAYKGHKLLAGVKFLLTIVSVRHARIFGSRIFQITQKI